MGFQVEAWGPDDKRAYYSVPVSALIEWIEKSRYNTFVQTDLRGGEEHIRAKMFKEKLIGKCSVMVFYE